MNPPQVTKPLSSRTLAADAERAGVVADELARGVGDPHLPASENSELAGSGAGKLGLEQRTAELPPG